MAVNISGGLMKTMLNAVRTAMGDGAMLVYTGSRPASANSAPTGTYLGKFTKSGGSWTAPGSVTNGLDYDAPAVGASQCLKPVADTWQLVAVATGRAGYYRWLPGSAADSGADDSTDTYLRADGRIATSGADLNLTDIDFVTGATYTINSHAFGFTS